MKSFSALSGLLLVVASCAVACSSASTTEGEEGKAAVVGAECSTENRNLAESQYRAALAGAKKRLSSSQAACEDGAYLSDIAGQLQAAITACGDYREIVRTRADAKSIHDALEESLALASFDGRLEVKDAQGKLVMRGLADVLKSGIAVWGPAPGAYGNMSVIRFRADNKAFLSRLDIEATPIDWIDTPVTYTVGATTADGAEITLTDDAGKSTTYRLIPGPEQPYDFRLIPVDPTNYEVFTAMPSECSA